MPNEKITFHQALFTMVLFGFGSSVIMGISSNVYQDAWIAILLGAALVTPIALMHIRIIKLFPEKNLFQVMEITLGKIVGKIFTVLLVWYAVHLAALVLHNFADFIQVFDMPETPQLVIMILMFWITVYLARSGILVVGKWSVFAFCFVLFVILFTFCTSLHQINLENLLPLFEASPSQIAKDTFGIFAFPFAESIIFLCAADCLYRQDCQKVHKIYFCSMGILVAIFLTVFIRNLPLLGSALKDQSYYPSYTGVRTIEVGDFLARIESSISSNFIHAGIVKITVCLLAASKGIANLFALPHPRTFVMPAGMLALALCVFLYKSTMEMFAFLEYYPFYSLPFQVIIPVIVWISAEIYTKKQKKKEAQTPADASQ